MSTVEILLREQAGKLEMVLRAGRSKHVSRERNEAFPADSIAGERRGGSSRKNRRYPPGRDCQPDRYRVGKTGNRKNV